MFSLDIIGLCRVTARFAVLRSWQSRPAAHHSHRLPLERGLAPNENARPPFTPFARAEVDLFVVSLVSRSGAVSISRPSALEAVVLARKLEREGNVAIRTPAGNILDLGEFIAVFDLH